MTETAGETRQNFGHYDVESVLGRGAMGMVYLARDRRIGRKVALKTVHINEKFDDESEAGEFYKRLQREAELCGALQHPNIVTLYEPGYENDVISWLATEYVEGENLREHMRKRKPTPLDEALRIVEGILRGLAYAHAKGIVHRDIKPANILLTVNGEAKIADFGIARPMDSNLTAVGEMLGTPSYMSPEQVRCQPVTMRSDLFSVGAVLYEMLTGVKAFGASDVTGILRNVCESTPKTAHDVNPNVPEALSAFCEKLYAKKPDDRFASAVEALAELERIRPQFGSIEITTEGPAKADADNGHSTLATPSPAPAALAGVGLETIPPSVTEPDYDVTPAVGGTPRPSPLQQIVPALIFWSVIGAEVAIFGGTAAVIGANFNAKPAFTYTVTQQRAFNAKKAQLRAARSLILAGKFEEGIAAYDAYIRKYPNSPAAKEELAKANEALAKSKAATVTVTEKKSSKTRQPPKKKNFFQRLFGGKH